MKRIKHLLLAAIMMFSVSTPLVLSATALAAPKDEVCKGIAMTGGNCNGAGQSGLDNIVTQVVNLLSLVVGIVAVIMIIIGGFKYVTSGGDSNKVSSAKNTIIYALVGLVIVALAQVIVNFVLNKAVA